MKSDDRLVFYGLGVSQQPLQTQTLTQGDQRLRMSIVRSSSTRNYTSYAKFYGTFKKLEQTTANIDMCPKKFSKGSIATTHPLWHNPYTLQSAGTCPPSKVALPMGGSGPLSNKRFLGPTCVCPVTPNSTIPILYRRLEHFPSKVALPMGEGIWLDP